MGITYVATGALYRVVTTNNEAGNSLNAVEREPVPTRVLYVRGLQRTRSLLVSTFQSEHMYAYMQTHVDSRYLCDADSLAGILTRVLRDLVLCE